ncbi:MAG TPA: Ada metal-binding domain-containing protein [Thermoanaerobaculia bacterium]|nr:Ada metal-binding domain-containing protein [Thermoanaerobaculia bacterium]
MPDAEPSTLSFAEKLARMYASDASANGLFVTGVLTTGIYCLPSCTARKPKAENVMFFATEAEAREAGLRPCKRCRPDQYYAGRDPDLERLSAAIAELKRDPLAVPDVQALARRVGVGVSKLHILVQRHARMTPAELIHENRIETAKRLLRSGDIGTVDAAFAVGYESVSAFYTRFKRATGVTPGVFSRRGSEGP